MSGSNIVESDTESQIIPEDESNPRVELFLTPQMGGSVPIETTVWRGRANAERVQHEKFEEWTKKNNKLIKDKEELTRKQKMLNEELTRKQKMLNEEWARLEEEGKALKAAKMEMDKGYMGSAQDDAAALKEESPDSPSLCTMQIPGRQPGITRAMRE